MFPMARPGGNPDFGTKYRFDNGRDEPLSEQVKAQVHPEVKLYLKSLANQRKCTVPDLIREAIDLYLAEQTPHAS
ncbi:MAG: CopG family transcriptional regulator [Rhizonema sp. PD37]|nr:CopG family transcriptional regulator [Rhizonema sp. PD37]